MLTAAPATARRRILLGPGPSEVSARVREAMARPLLGHLDPEFLGLMTQTQDMLRRLFRTTNPLTFPVSGTGSAGMEACFVNLLEPGERALICVNGQFGARMADVATRTGADVVSLERPWGKVFDADEIERGLKLHRPKLVAIVHAETSTGALQPLSELGRMCREHDALLVVDAVTSLGGLPVETDLWQIDAIYSGTQKCLSVPPGLAPVSFGPRAIQALEARKRPVQSWYLDITMIQRYWGSERFYHHTAPISMIYALHEGLRVIEEEGLEKCWERHRRTHGALKAGLEAFGMELVPDSENQLPTLNAVRVPRGIDEASLRQRLLSEYGIEIGGGLGEFKGKIWRIGLMGESSRSANVGLLLGAMEESLAGMGFGMRDALTAMEKYLQAQKAG